MRVEIMRKTAELTGMSPPLVNERKCGEAVLEVTAKHPLGYGSTTCQCGVVFDVYVREGKLFRRKKKVVLEVRSGDRTAIHSAKLIET